MVECLQYFPSWDGVLTKQDLISKNLRPQLGSSRGKSVREIGLSNGSVILGIPDPTMAQVKLT